MTTVNLKYRRADGDNIDGILIPVGAGTILCSPTERRDTSAGQMLTGGFSADFGEAVVLYPGTWRFEVTYAGPRGNITEVEHRVVPATGTFDVDDLDEVGAPGSGTLPSNFESRLAAVETGLANVSGGATTLAGISNMSAFMRTVNDDADAATARTTLGAAADSAVVHNTGTETVAGVKTFSSSPIVPTPTTSTQAANKSYVDAAGVTAANISDASTIGRSILTAADAAAVRSLIGAGTGSSGLTLGTTAGTAADAGAVDTRIDAIDVLISDLNTAVALLAPKASPVFTGNPTAPTPTESDNDTSVATTGFVQGLTAWARGIHPRVVWTGSVWPSRASVVPAGYSGAVEYWSPYDSTATSPTDRLTNDLWTRKRVA